MQQLPASRAVDLLAPENTMSTTQITPETPAQGQTVNVTVLYRLSPAGQKAALLAGKPAAKDQTVTGEIPIELLDLCTIKEDGSVEAMLRGPRGITREGLVYGNSGYSNYLMDLDAPPQSAEAALIRVRDGLAAKAAEVRGQLEADEQRSRERDAMRHAIQRAERRAILDKAAAIMAADPEAIPELPYEVTQQTYPEVMERARRIEARDAAKKQAEVDAAAANARAKREYIGQWVAEHGTPDQMERRAAGLLPEQEALAAIEELAYAPILAAAPVAPWLMGMQRYKKLTRADAYDVLDEEQQTLVDEWELDVKFRSNDATEATAAQFAALKRLQDLMPGAECKLRLHDSTFDHDDIPWGLATRMSVQVKAQAGPFSFAREYAAE